MSWKKRWKKELENQIPELREEVRQMPIDVAIPSSEKTATKKSCASVRFSRKRLFACISACACACVVLCLSIFLAPKTPTTGVQTEVIALEINPKAAFVVKDNRIEAVVSMNADADVILGESRSAEIEGKPVGEGVKIYVDYAARLGYLRLEEENAVRISTSTADGCIDDVKGSLIGYFRQKGSYIAVVKEKLSEETLSERLGITPTDTDLAERLVGATDLYAYRQAEQSDMQTAYKNTLLEGKLDDYKEIRADIEEIHSLNRKIKLHLFSSLGNGYWDLPEDRGEDEEFLALVAKMEERLARYETVYGKPLTSEAELDEARAEANELPVDILLTLLSDVTAELFAGLVGELETLGMDASFLVKLQNLPQTVEEFAASTAAYFEERYTALTARYRVAYETAREEIAEADYEAYIAGLERKYSSLSLYWEELKNKK